MEDSSLVAPPFPFLFIIYFRRRTFRYALGGTAITVMD